MLGGISRANRQMWQRIWHHRYRHWLWLYYRYRSPQFYRFWLLLLAALALAAIEVGTGQIIDGFTAVTAQGKINRVPCYKWPTIAEIEQILAQNPEAVERIENVPPSGASVAIGTWRNSWSGLIFRCEGKGFLDISYGGYWEMRAIKSIIGNRKYFLGVPYDLRSY